jgi:hypothetical protein
MLRGLGLDAWFDELAYRRCETFDQRGAFILGKLKDHAAKLADVLADLYREAVPEPTDITRFEWQTILAYLGASEEAIADVQARIGRPWR